MIRPNPQKYVFIWKIGHVDFLLTSMSSQLGALNFISEGSTKRKEILAKFLDNNSEGIKKKSLQKNL